jgi:C_GCAxxG_C_C family probable redox protein
MVLAVGECMLGEEAARRCVRWASGLAGGLGGGKQEMCGALSGGVMVIGGLYGRDGPTDDDDEPAWDPALRFRERFLAAFGTTQCEPLYEQVHSPDGPGSCSQVAERAARILWEVLSETREGSG